MRTFDLTPLYPFSIGFDYLDQLSKAAAKRKDGASAYPPYDIVRKGNDSYRITLAVAGFSEKDLNVEVKENTLTITGKQAAPKDKPKVEYLHRGIGLRAFERNFELAEHIRVNGASFENGLLSVTLERVVPEEKKPRSIQINAKGK